MDKSFDKWWFTKNVSRKYVNKFFDSIILVSDRRTGGNCKNRWWQSYWSSIAQSMASLHVCYILTAKDFCVYRCWYANRPENSQINASIRMSINVFAVQILFSTKSTSMVPLISILDHWQLSSFFTENKFIKNWTVLQFFVLTIRLLLHIWLMTDGKVLVWDIAPLLDDHLLYMRRNCSLLPLSFSIKKKRFFFNAELKSD